MKATILLAPILPISIGYSQAQCRNQPSQPSCVGGKNEGRGGRGCHIGDRWYYSRTDKVCPKMNYKGCDGNNNRWCSKAACEQKCKT